MLEKINQRLLLKIVLGLLIAFKTSAQVLQELPTDINNSYCFFEKVELENTFYLNPLTMVSINPQMHEKLCKGKHTLEFDSIAIANLIPPFAPWEQSSVNPYRNSAETKPFKLRFEQSEFTPPINRRMVVTSRYGMRYSGPHRGIDIDLITGDTVSAILPGRVRFVGYSKGHGKTVVVQHTNDVETVYAHLSKFLVKENDVLTSGGELGLGGNTGNSRGSHLHLEIRHKGICIHPEYILNFDGSNSIASKEIWISRIATLPNLHSSYRKSKIRPHQSTAEAISSENTLPKYHIVQKGDTLSYIARAYSVDINEICTLNSISQKSVLSIGQVIEYR